MLKTIKHHYRKLPTFHRALLGIMLFLGMFVAMLRGLSAAYLPFENAWPVMFPLLNTWVYSEAHFAYGGNDFAGIIFWGPMTPLSTPQNITIGVQSINCSTQLNGLYYNNERGRRLWPLDTGDLAILSGWWQSGYNLMTMSGWWFTNCTGAGVHANEVYGQINHNRSGIAFHMIAGVEYDFPNNQMLTNNLFSGSLRILSWNMTWFMRDNYGGIADIDLWTWSFLGCGDGILDTGEECDDGNNNNGDGCSSSCQIEPSSGCNTGFQGDVTFWPGPHVINAWGISYYTDLTNIITYVSVTEPVNYLITWDFVPGIFTGFHPWTGLIYPIALPATLTGINVRNRFYSTYQTWSCTYLDAGKRIYVDTLPPTPPTLLGPTNGTGVCASSLFQLSWAGAYDTGAGIASYTYKLYNSGLVLSGSVWPTATGAQINASLLPIGSYSRVVITTDQLGHSSTSATGTFVIGSQYCSGSCSCCLLNGVMYLSSIPSVRDADLSRAYLSDVFYVFGLSTPTRVSVSNGMLFVNGTGVGSGAYVTSSDQLQIDLISSDQFDTTVSSVVHTNGFSMTAAYNVTTKLDGSESCNLTDAEKLSIVNIYDNMKAQYDNDPNRLQDFLNTFDSMVQDNVDLTNDCSLQYLLDLLDGDLNNNSDTIDTSIHIAPNCKQYNIGYDNSNSAYYSPDMSTRYYFINRESLIRHIDYYNPGDCHINTYGNDSRSDTLNNDQKHIAPNGKIYTIAGSNGAYTSPEFVSAKYFDSMDGILRYIDGKNPAKEIWNHQVDTSFTPITYAAPNGKEYKIYKTNRWYMSYKLMKVKYYETLSELENHITTQNPAHY